MPWSDADGRREAETALRTMGSAQTLDVWWLDVGPLTLPMHDALCSAIEAGNPTAAEGAALALIEQAERDLADRLNLEQSSKSTHSAPEKK